MSRLIIFSFPVIFFLLFVSCRQADTNPFKVQKPAKLDKETSISLNKYWIQDEHFKIKTYCERQGWKMSISTSGLNYMIIDSSSSRLDSPNIGDEVILSYDIRLLDPNQTRCYHSDSNGLARFKVDQSLVESGLHEVVTYLGVGDSALVVLPHYLAHGIAGDNQKIPPLSPVLYFIKLVDVKT
ncbi:MAG: FKBP-type peptidyl-prolyl cis-trans isomerase [Bacteroidota bacterium]|nr:FKBP-type peptidyl-prolyl cis-trans isomerase [Bacteroidota bacterium]